MSRPTFIDVDVSTDTKMGETRRRLLNLARVEYMSSGSKYDGMGETTIVYLINQDARLPQKSMTLEGNVIEKLDQASCRVKCNVIIIDCREDSSGPKPPE